MMNRMWAMPSPWTFTIKPIRELIMRYVGNGDGWIDPFAGKNSPAQLTNDINPAMPTMYHLDALDFVQQCPLQIVGALFDPPYSLRQVSEHYAAAGRKATSLDTSANFYSRVLDAITPKVVSSGYAIRCGWCSNGFGKKRGFEMIEVLLVAHGGSKNDTIVTVERKIQSAML